ncbi:MAG: hypothetical protein DRI34_08605 [Deltaproteobacteria bacterium]|nr:MAG: hypothetical protein DRI34_08605 [Deltaproteobacteria bacterium]
MNEGVLARFAARISGVRPAEGRRTLLATCFYFFFVAHVVMVKSAANALFLSRHDPHRLPLLYILLAVLVGVVVVFASKILADPRRRLLRTLSLLGVAGGLLLCWLSLHFRLLAVSPVLYLFGEVSATALNIQFWSVAGDIFDPQEGKRVFGILSAGGMSGSIFGGVFVHQAGLYIGTVNLVLAAALVLGFCSVLAHALGRHQGRSDALPARQAFSLRRGFRYVLGESYPRTFGLLMLLGAVLTSFVDYFFRISARSFLGEDQLAALFGDLNVYIGLLSVVFLFALSGRLLRRIGIFGYLLIVPAGMLLACAATAVYPLFLTVFLLKIIENAGSLSINQAGLQLLYNPVPTVLRVPVRGVIDGFLRKMGFAVGGGMLLLVAPYLQRPWYELVVASMVLLYALMLLRLRRLYVESLDEKIRVGASRPRDLRLDDAATQQVLLKTLASTDALLVETSLRLLAKLPEVDLRGQLRGLLQHPQERVRLAAIEAVAQRGYLEMVFDLLALINSSTRRCRVAAVRAVVTLDPQRAAGALGPYLHSDDPGLVAAAIESLIKLQGDRPDNPAVAILEQVLAAGHRAPDGVRRETARLLGRLGETRYADRLLDYLADPDASVRRIAASSCAGVYRAAFVPRLLQMLSERDTRPEARQALAAYGDRVIDILEEWLNDRGRPIEVRLRLPRVIRLIGTQRAGEVLLFSNIQDDAFLRYRIALALSGMRQNPNIHFDAKWALEAVDRRLDSYRFYAPRAERLAASLPRQSLVVRVLHDRLEQNIEVAFRVLGLVYSHHTLMSIYHQLRNGGRESWSDAMELLDNVVDHESRERLFPILERHHQLLSLVGPEQVVSPPPDAREALLELSESRDLLLRAAAVYTRCRMGEDCAHLCPELVKGKDTMTLMEIVLFLESVKIFKQNNLDDLTALAAITKERTFAPGQHILREGEPGDALFIITTGEAEIRKKGKKLLTVGEKASLGSVSLLDQKPHAADAVAVTECRTLVIDRIDFMDLVADRVELLHGIFLALTDRLRALLAVTEEGGLAEEAYEDGPTNPV